MHPRPRVPRRAPARPAAGIVAGVITAGVIATVPIACGGDDLPSRQDFVDSIEAQDDGLITEDVASCMYDGLDDDGAAAEAVANWSEDEPVPAELIDLATECLNENDSVVNGPG